MHWYLADGTPFVRLTREVGSGAIEGFFEGERQKKANFKFQI
jgi:hypothetical protein